MKPPSAINCITKFKRNIRSDIPLTIDIDLRVSDLKAPDIEIILLTNALEFSPIYGKAKLYIYGIPFPAQETEFICNDYPYLINMTGVDPEEHELEVKLYFENGYSTTWSNKLLLGIS